MSDKKSLVIIGGGITGLSAGLAWVKNVDTDEKPVLILEKQPVIGGLVTSYKRQGYLFDTAQIIPDINDILEYFDIKIELKQFKGFYARIFITNPETGEIRPYKIPSSLQGFEYYLINRFPGDAKAIKRFLKYTCDMYDELYNLKYHPTFAEKLRMLFACRKILGNSSKTFADYYKKFKIKSIEIKEIFDVFAAFSGLSAERVAALLTVGAINATLKGAYRPVKGFIQFPNVLRKKYLELGGQLKTNCEVKKIHIENGMAKGVVLNSGELIEADYIITTADPKFAMKELVGLDILKKLDRKYARKVEKMKMSASSFHISLGLDDDINLAELGFDCGYNILTTGGDTFEQLFRSFDESKIGFTPGKFHCAVIVPSLTTKTKNTVIIRVVPIPISNWKELRDNNKWLYDKEKNDMADFFIELVDTYLIPGLKKHIVVKDIATPATFERYCGSPTGSNYDMAPYPDNYGKNRLKMITPVKNLLQPKFSNGIWPSLQAGLQAVDYILDRKIMDGYCRFMSKKNK